VAATIVVVMSFSFRVLEVLEWGLWMEMGDEASINGYFE
jgi:hypothetical protein